MRDMRCSKAVVLYLGAVLVLGAFLVAPLLAQEPPPVQPPAATDGFVPLSEFSAREVLPAAPLVFYAYGFVWVVLLGYLWAIWRQVGRVEQDLEAVRRRVGDGRGGQ